MILPPYGMLAIVIDIIDNFFRQLFKLQNRIHS